MAQSQVTDGFADLKKSDLEDKDLFKLNDTLHWISTKIGTFFIPGNQSVYPSIPTFRTVLASAQNVPPDNPNEFITRGSADALYSPSVARLALVTGAYPPSSTVNPVQPISTGGGSSSGSGAGAGSVTYYVGTISAGTYTPNITNGEVQEITLTSNVTINAVTGASGPAKLKLVLVQDATGSRTVTWDSSYIGVNITDVDFTPGTYSVYEFILRSSDLRPFVCAQPVTGLVWP